MSEQVTVLITGGSRRIGASITTYLHQMGFRVLIHCHQSGDEARALADALNEKRKESAHVLSADLSHEQEAVRLIQEAIDWAGRLDVLVNNASIFSRYDCDWDQMFVTNVKAPYWLSKAAYASLAKTEGVIINITDAYAHTHTPLSEYAAYCQTKAALAMQTKALAVEFAPNIRVNAVAPGSIIWPEGDNRLSFEQQQSILNKTPLRRHGDPLFVAKAVFALIDNPYITGESVLVDGGRHLKV